MSCSLTLEDCFHIILPKEESFSELTLNLSLTRERSGKLQIQNDLNLFVSLNFYLLITTKGQLFLPFTSKQFAFAFFYIKPFLCCVKYCIISYCVFYVVLVKT